MKQLYYIYPKQLTFLLVKNKHLIGYINNKVRLYMIKNFMTIEEKRH